MIKNSVNMMWNSMNIIERATIKTLFEGQIILVIVYS